MNDYQIKIPSQEEISKKKLDYIRHPKLIALRGVQIGPGWSLPDPDRTMGMRGVPRRKTKAPWHAYKQAKNKLCLEEGVHHLSYREKRALRNKMARKSRRRNG